MNTILDETYEHDNCGMGVVVSIERIKTHKTVDDALHIVKNWIIVQEGMEKVLRVMVLAF